MPRDSRTHFRNRFRELCDSSKFSQLLRARVALVIEILPATSRVFSNRLHSSVRRRIDEHVSPCRRNFQVVDPVEIGFSKAAALRFVAKDSFGRAESTYADVLQTCDFCLWNEICLSIGIIRSVWKVNFE